MNLIFLSAAYAVYLIIILSFVLSCSLTTCKQSGFLLSHSQALLGRVREMFTLWLIFPQCWGEKKKKNLSDYSVHHEWRFLKFRDKEYLQLYVCFKCYSPLAHSGSSLPKLNLYSLVCSNWYEAEDLRPSEDFWVSLSVLLSTLLLCHEYSSHSGPSRECAFS